MDIFFWIIAIVIIITGFLIAVSNYNIRDATLWNTIGAIIIFMGICALCSSYGKTQRGYAADCQKGIFDVVAIDTSGGEAYLLVRDISDQKLRLYHFSRDRLNWRENIIPAQIQVLESNRGCEVFPEPIPGKYE